MSTKLDYPRCRCCSFPANADHPLDADGICSECAENAFRNHALQKELSGETPEQRLKRELDSAERLYDDACQDEAAAQKARIEAGEVLDAAQEALKSLNL